MVCKDSSGREDNGKSITNYIQEWVLKKRCDSWNDENSKEFWGSCMAGHQKTYNKSIVSLRSSSTPCMCNQGQLEFLQEHWLLHL